IVGDDCGAGAFRDCDGVAEMVAMAVADKDKVGASVVGLDRRGRIAGEERIDQSLQATRFDGNASMTKPANPRRHGMASFGVYWTSAARWRAVMVAASVESLRSLIPALSNPLFNETLRLDDGMFFGKGVKGGQKQAARSCFGGDMA